MDVEIAAKHDAAGPERAERFWGSAAARIPSVPPPVTIVLPSRSCNADGAQAANPRAAHAVRPCLYTARTSQSTARIEPRHLSSSYPKSFKCWSATAERHLGSKGGRDSQSAGPRRQHHALQRPERVDTPHANHSHHSQASAWAVPPRSQWRHAAGWLAFKSQPRCSNVQTTRAQHV
jgi:hypothetical protein